MKARKKTAKRAKSKSRVSEPMSRQQRVHMTFHVVRPGLDEGQEALEVVKRALGKRALGKRFGKRGLVMSYLLEEPSLYPSRRGF